MRIHRNKKYRRKHIQIDNSINEKTIEVVKEKKIEKKFVIPGNEIGVIEEYVTGIGTYAHKGKIYSSNTGIVNIKEQSKTIEVIPATNTPHILKEGDIFVGRIINMRDSMALISISAIQGKSKQDVTSFRTGAVHISNVRSNFVEDLYKEFLPFDIVKAKIINIENMQLSTKDDNLGVMHATCSNCRGVLKKDGDKLKCFECDRVETRKLSSDYGTGII